MSPVMRGEEFDDAAGFTMPADARDEALVGPVHAASLSLGKLQSHLAIALGSSAQFSRTFTNRNRCTFCSVISANLGSGLGRDRLDGSTAFAEHDLPLALAFHENRSARFRTEPSRNSFQESVSTVER